MTLCIAAVAEDAGRPNIVATFDMKIGSYMATGEIEYKMARLAGGLLAMYAAEDVAEALELLQAYDNHLCMARFRWDMIVETLRAPLHEHLTKKAEAYVRRRLKITMERFLQFGEREIEQNLRRDVQNELSEIRCGVELIICGFNGDKPRIFIVGEDVREQTHFACIGSGYVAAEHALFRRKQQSRTLLGQTLYNVWEAKRFGEMAPTVGQQTYTMVLDAKYPLRLRHIVQEKGAAFFEEQYSRFGPQPVPRDLPLWDGMITTEETGSLPSPMRDQLLSQPDL